VRIGAIVALAALSSLTLMCPGWAAPADDAAAAPKPAAAKCDRSKFRIILDVGHTRESYGAMSARNVPEFEFNLNLGRTIEGRLKADGFTESFLMVTEGKARPSLMTRVARANKRGADLFLSIHHDSVPGIYNESWEFEGKKRHFNDLFAGYSVFVSQQNPHYRESLRFAKLVGNQMASQDLVFARQYDQWFMGKFQRELLDHDAGVYRYDQLIVLKMTTMPAVLLESGSIINRDEELKMASQEHKDKVATAVLAAVSEYCDTRTAAPPQVSQPSPKPPDAKPKIAKPQPKPQTATSAATRKRGWFSLQR
jgi:N-acetylmuramoyl-L-alanine amidase